MLDTANAKHITIFKLGQSQGFVKQKSDRLGIKKILYWNVMKTTVNEYIVNTKLNGAHYLIQSTKSLTERFIWFGVPVIIILFSVYLSSLIYGKYLDLPFQLISSPRVPVIQAPFPGISICRSSLYSQEQLNIFIKSLKIPQSIDKTDVARLLKAIQNDFEYENITTAEVVNLQKLFELNNITIRTIKELSRINCESLLTKCQLNGRDFTCYGKHKLSFTHIATHLGICCTFNYKQISYSNEILKNAMFGYQSGLTVIGKVDTTVDKNPLLNGYSFIIHQPDNFGDLRLQPKEFVRLSIETFIKINTKTFYPSNQLLTLPIKQRRCISDNDVENYETIKSGMTQKYREYLCFYNCITANVYNLCKCRVYAFRTEETKNSRACGLQDLKCMTTNNCFSTENCDCLPACFGTEYQTTSETLEFSANNYSIDRFLETEKLSKEHFIARIYMDRQIISGYKKIVPMSWIALLSNLGGVLNLGIGISLISIVEFLFFACIRYNKNVKTERSKRDHVLHELQSFPTANKVKIKF